MKWYFQINVVLCCGSLFWYEMHLKIFSLRIIISRLDFCSVTYELLLLSHSNILWWLIYPIWTNIKHVFENIGEEIIKSSMLATIVLGNKLSHQLSSCIYIRSILYVVHLWFRKNLFISFVILRNLMPSQTQWETLLKEIVFTDRHFYRFGALF